MIDERFAEWLRTAERLAESASPDELRTRKIEDAVRWAHRWAMVAMLAAAVAVTFAGAAIAMWVLA